VLCDEKFDKVGSFTYLRSENCGFSGNLNNRIAQACVFFSQSKKVGRNRNISLRTKIRIVEPTVMIMVKLCSETGALQKAEDDILNFSEKNCLKIVLGTRLTDCMS
jgi:hypothetical protein